MPIGVACSLCGPCLTAWKQETRKFEVFQSEMAAPPCPVCQATRHVGVLPRSSGLPRRRKSRRPRLRHLPQQLPAAPTPRVGRMLGTEARNTHTHTLTRSDIEHPMGCLGICHDLLQKYRPEQLPCFNAESCEQKELDIGFFPVVWGGPHKRASPSIRLGSANLFAGARECGNAGPP